MPVGLESHGLAVVAPYNAPATVQDHQSGGQGQQPTPDAGFSGASAFEQTKAAAAPQQATEADAGQDGGDLLSKLSGFIRAVGDVVIQLGELIRSAGGALSGPEGDHQAPAAPATPAAPGAQPQAPTAGAPQPANAPAAAPVQARQAAPLASVEPRATGPQSLASKGAPATQRGIAKAPASSPEPASANPGQAAAAPRGGGRTSQGNR